MKIHCVWEHNGSDTLLYAVECVGAYTRGENLEKAAGKMPGEIVSYLRWLGQPLPESVKLEIIQDKSSQLCIADADSDVLFDCEEGELSKMEYSRLKELALKSAEDFQSLYCSVPDADISALEARSTFYGDRPITAREMYEHTKSVNSYYFGEIGVEADSEGTILECRRCGFELLEKKTDYLANPVIEGSYGELWSLKKVLRRFVWHDRIHAKAMYRMAEMTFGIGAAANPFRF